MTGSVGITGRVVSDAICQAQQGRPSSKPAASASGSGSSASCNALLKAAADGANIVIAAKSAEAHAKLPGTIHSVAQEVVQARGQALPIATDARDEAQLKKGFAYFVLVMALVIFYKEITAL